MSCENCDNCECDTEYMVHSVEQVWRNKIQELKWDQETQTEEMFQRTLQRFFKENLA